MTVGCVGGEDMGHRPLWKPIPKRKRLGGEGGSEEEGCFFYRNFHKIENMKFRSMGADAQMVLDQACVICGTQKLKTKRKCMTCHKNFHPGCLHFNRKADDWSCPKCKKGEKFVF